MKRHLHLDYGTAQCGRDASHILMTYEENETDCALCLKNVERRRNGELKPPHEVRRERFKQQEAEARKVREKVTRAHIRATEQRRA